MRRAAVLALALVPLLAGCTDGDAGPATIPPVSPGLPAAELTEGGFYAFAHAGGSLTFRLDGEGDAAFDLYDGDDVRLGSVGFSSETTRTGFHRIDGVGPGDLVLRVQTLNGTLRVESGDQAVARFQPLGTLVERVVLASTDATSPDTLGLGLAPVLDPTPVDDQVDVALRRAPADLRLLGGGLWSNLSVEVRSERGVVLRADDVGGGVSLGQARRLDPLPVEAALQNLRGGALVADIRADDLHGAIVLESRSYSRAGLPTPALAGDAEAGFTYGPLSTTPTAFAVHAQATRLLLWQADARPGRDEAAVALFGPDDRRIATVLVPSRGLVEVAVAGGGDHVAVLLSGNATLGADRAPADFDLRPLETQDLVVPSSVAGDAARGLYAIASEEVEAPTAYAFVEDRLESSRQPFDGGGGPPPPMFPFGCDTGRFLRVDHGGEAVLVWPEEAGVVQQPPAPVLQAALALSAGLFTVTHDGFGDDGCARPALVIRSYVRPV